MLQMRKYNLKQIYFNIFVSSNYSVRIKRVALNSDANPLVRVTSLYLASRVTLYLNTFCDVYTHIVPFKGSFHSPINFPNLYKPK